MTFLTLQSQFVDTLNRDGLERGNRMLRRLFRPKGAFHSVTGLLATIARILNPIRLI